MIRKCYRGQIVTKVLYFLQDFYGPEFIHKSTKPIQRIPLALQGEVTHRFINKMTYSINMSLKICSYAEIIVAFKQKIQNLIRKFHFKF
jgi:hypothetical protein